MGEEVNYNELFGLEPEGEETVTTEEPEEVQENGPPDEGTDGRGSGENSPPQEGNSSEPVKQKPQDGSREKNGAPAQSRIAWGEDERNQRLSPTNGRGRQSDFSEDGAAYLDNVIRGLGITDPYTGKAVTTKAEYDAYRQRAYDERREAVKRRSGLTDADLDEFINSTPAVQRAMADAAAARDMITRQRQAEAKRRIDEEVAKISAMDPGVKTLADLTDKPYSGRLTQLVKRGYDLADAYVVANQEALRRQSAEASRQAAYNAQQGKAGMTATKQTGQGGETLPVPKDVLEMYRALNPEMTNAEIRDDYNKYLRGRK